MSWRYFQSESPPHLCSRVEHRFPTHLVLLVTASAFGVAFTLEGLSHSADELSADSLLG